MDKNTQTANKLIDYKFKSMADKAMQITQVKKSRRSHIMRTLMEFYKLINEETPSGTTTSINTMRIKLEESD